MPANFLGRAKRTSGKGQPVSGGSFFSSQRDALNTRSHVFVRFQLPDGRVGSAKGPSVERAAEVIKLQYPQAVLQLPG